jgi:Flp pilus assembly protein TadG
MRSGMRSEKGQATVELALSMTILVMLLVGIIDFGRIFYSYLSIEHGSREGARTASIGKTNTEIIDKAVTATSGLVTSADVHIDPSDKLLRTRGSDAKVTLNYEVSFMLIPKTITLTSETVMRVENE